MRTRRGFARFSLALAASASVGLSLVLFSWSENQRDRPPHLARSNLRQLSLGILQHIDAYETWESIAVPRIGIPTTSGEVRLEQLPGKEIKNEDLRRLEWQWCRLQGVTFTACDLRRANLRGAHLQNAVFYGSDLRGADLLQTDLTGAIYDHLTKWPAGFSPEAHGARLED